MTDRSSPFRLLLALVLGGSLTAALLFTSGCTIWPSEHSAALDVAPGAVPDRIALTIADDPLTTRAVTWRTDASITAAFAEIAVARPSPDFVDGASVIPAVTEPLETDVGTAHYHTAFFTDLEPGTVYAYRVGSPEAWSEWIQFRLPPAEADTLAFLYLGDAQNDILSFWSRAVRAAYRERPNADFVLHAGDLVNRPNSDLEWGEWFAAGGFIHGMIPIVAIPGNHEYTPVSKRLSKYWRPQFAFPRNGPDVAEETAYSLDWPDLRLIALNSNEKIAEQAPWLAEQLAREPGDRWTIVTFHHPVYSASRGRGNRELQELWRPLFIEHGVDLVLQGHDHAYARGNNVPTGVAALDTTGGGPVYVVSVSGPKMYDLNRQEWMGRSGENLQLIQSIAIAGDTLEYRARTVDGALYDAFAIIRDPDGGPNRIVDRMASDTSVAR